MVIPINAPRLDPRPRIPRPAMTGPTGPSPEITKGQYRVGLPGGPGGGPGVPPPRPTGYGGGGYQPGGLVTAPPTTPPVTPPVDPAAAAKQAAINAFKQQLSTWQTQMPQSGDPAAIAAWRAAVPQFAGFAGGFGNAQRPPVAGVNRMPANSLAAAPRLGGSQRGDIPFGGFRAKGGGWRAGKAYVVGEEGPEVVVPEEDGTVIPSGGLRSGGAGRGVSGGSVRSGSGRGVGMGGGYSGGGGGTLTPAPTPTPSPTTGSTGIPNRNDYPDRQSWYRALLAWQWNGGLGQNPNTPTPTPTTPTPTPTTPTPTTGGVGGGAQSPGMAFTRSNMRPMPGFQFPQYTQTWAMNPDVFGRTY